MAYRFRQSRMMNPMAHWRPANIQVKAAEPGQYRLSYVVTDDKKHSVEGGYLLVVMGDRIAGDTFRFNDIELIPDKGAFVSKPSVQEARELFSVRRVLESEVVRLFVARAKPKDYVVLDQHIKLEEHPRGLQTAVRFVPKRSTT